MRLQRLFFVALIVAVTAGVIEYRYKLTPLEQLVALFTREKKPEGEAAAGKAKTIIRMGIASWQMGEMEWERIIAEYEKAHNYEVDVRLNKMPAGAGTFSAMMLFWASGYTDFDVIVAYADEEIYPFIEYNWETDDPERRGLLVNVRKYLTKEQLESFVPAVFGGCTREDPDTGELISYALPWMAEVQALNYNKKFFAQAGIEKLPETWDEVEATCRKLMGIKYRDVPVAPLAMDFGKASVFGQNCYIPILAAYRQGTGVTDEDGRLDVSSPEAVRTIETLKRWYDKGYISPGCLTSGGVEQDLRTLRSAMYPHWQTRGLWAVADHGTDTIGLAPTPGVSVAGSLVSTYGCVIPKCSPVIEETVAFCYETFCTDTYGFQTALAVGWKDEKTGASGLGGKMPVMKDMYDKEGLPEGIMSLRKALDKGYTYPDQATWAQCTDILVVEFQRYLSQKYDSAEEMLAAVRKRYAEEVYVEE